MKRIATLVAIIVVLLVGPVTGAALAAPRQPAPSAVAGALTLVLDELAPRVVTASGPTVLTVTGTLTNTGDETVTDIGVRLQRGQPLTSEGAVRDALEGGAPTDSIAPQFQELPDALDVGDRVPVRLTVPLSGAPESTLALAATGVYELLVNVNGVPGEGDRARLAAVRMLLPVVGLPDLDGADAVSTPPAAATPFSLLYPVVDVPRRLTTAPGEPVRLTDDTLADSFAPTGRLGGLVAALAEAAPAGSPVRTATCVVTDADLLQTAQAMSQGYVVPGADGSLVPGRGAEVAGAWLASFAEAARGMCVLALPFADADVVALTRGELETSAVGAVTAGRGLVADLLGTPVLPDTAWPADGVVDEAGLATYAEGGVRSLVLSADGLDLPAQAESAGTVPVATTGPATTAVVADPLVTLAAGGPISVATTVAGRGGAAAAAAAGGPLSGQDVLGTVAFRAVEDAPTGGPLVIAPPHRWNVDGVAARALLDGFGTLVDEGLLTARGLGSALATPTSTTERTLDYPIGAGAREVAPNAVAAIGPVLDDIGDLDSSVVDDELGVDPDDLFDPLVLGAVRPASAAWRGTPELATDAAAALADRVTELRGTVAVLEPPSPFSLGTSTSPLLLTVANGLPVTMRVRVEISSTSGLRVAPIPVVEVPPFGRRQIQASAEVQRSGVFTVDATVRTIDGGLLGAPSRLQVRSTAYGTITLWLTGTAGVLLVVLAARRILRRIRSEPGRNTPRPPRPGSPETIPDTAETALPADLRGPPPTSTPPPAPEDRTLPAPPRPLPASNGPIPAGPTTGRNRPGPSGPSGPAGPPVRRPDVPGHVPVPPGTGAPLQGRPPLRPPGAR
ncbi:DUF6049 family protein [Pseudonocardia abyssalis]|uniref:Glycoprotein n=1 Tax=Pseudonocardia abyssalis TaxID=2792008 RepID=A0ABS6UYJ5_9PSEU|nr:DUF6049 family protein [Pseudonocardia abyssalis]MBW0118374.1 hypothetical protein [Pseudonocardia abyssalis]MBW0137304.1 hypothetical protein [Pseudonocardia abyssalis]